MANQGENNPAAPPLLGQVQMPAAAAKPIDPQVLRDARRSLVSLPKYD